MNPEGSKNPIPFWSFWDPSATSTDCVDGPPFSSIAVVTPTRLFGKSVEPYLDQKEPGDYQLIMPSRFMKSRWFMSDKYKITDEKKNTGDYINEH